MKIKKFSLVMLAVLVFACSSEENIETQDGDLIIQVENDPQTNGKGFGEGKSCVEKERWCDENYVYPTVEAGGLNYISYFIHYNTSLTESEVLCIRYDYFQCHPTLVMSQIQPSDIHEDVWRVPTGKPEDEVSQSSCNDPRLNQACGD